MSDLEEDSGPDLIDGVFYYITESKYPSGCSVGQKRTIRKKAKMFVVQDGVLYFKKRRKLARCECMKSMHCM